MAKKQNAWQEAQQLFGTVFNAGKNAVSTAVSSLPQVTQRFSQPVKSQIPASPNLIQRFQTPVAAPRIGSPAVSQQVRTSIGQQPLVSLPGLSSRPILRVNDLSPTNYKTPILGPMRQQNAQQQASLQALQQRHLANPNDALVRNQLLRADFDEKFNAATNVGGGRNTAKDLAKLSVKQMRGNVSKAISKIHPQDVYEFDRAVDTIRNAGATLNERVAATKIVDTLSKRYLPKETLKKVFSNPDVNKRLDSLRKVFGAADAAPEYPIPQLGDRIPGGKPKPRGPLMNEDPFQIGKLEAPEFDIPKLRIKDPGIGLGIGMIEREAPIPNPTKPFFNVNRMGVPNQTKQAVSDFVTSPEGKAQIEQAVGEPLTHKQVNTMAQVVPELAKNYTREDALQLGAEAKALRNKVAELSELGVNDEQFQEALIRDKAFGTFLARLFGQRATISQPGEKSIFNEVIGTIIKKGHDPEKVIEAAKGVDFNNPQQLTQFFRQFVKATPGDWADLLRYNSMLSSPLTQIVNISSNVQGTGVMTPIQKTVEGTLDAIGSAFTGKERTRYAGEGAAYAKGFAGSAKEAFRDFFDTFKGTIAETNPDTRQIPLSTGGVSRGVENVLRVPTTTLEAFDRLFMRLTKGGLESSNAYRLKKAGKVVSTPNVQKEAEKLLYRGNLAEKGEGIVSNAIGTGGNLVKAATKADNAAVRWMAKLTLPFVNIGTNLAKQGAEFNPVLGAVNMIGNTDKTAQASKMLIGGAITAAAVPLALSDRLTFGNTPKSRDASEVSGIQPYAIKIGDQWVQYSKMHPAIAFQLATTAAIAESLKSGKLSETAAEKLANGSFNALRFIADATYFKNVGDFVSSINGDVEGLTRLTSNYPSQFVPFRATAGWINRMVDTYQRKPETDVNFITKSFQQVMTQIPGLSQTLPQRYGPDGQPMQYQNPVLNAISPARVTTERPENRKFYEESKGAGYLYEQLKQLPRDEANTRAKELKERNPALYGQLKRVATQVKLGLTPEEIKIGDLGVGSGDRSRAIAEQLRTLQTREEKNAYVTKLRDGKILTDDVLDQLKQMRKRGEL